ncbi:hypothetical protein ACWGIB_27470 [Streptomyces xiamenensis]
MPAQPEPTHFYILTLQGPTGAVTYKGPLVAAAGTTRDVLFDQIHERVYRDRPDMRRAVTAYFYLEPLALS